MVCVVCVVCVWCVAGVVIYFMDVAYGVGVWCVWCVWCVCGVWPVS